jgi:hypothetical protein
LLAVVTGLVVLLAVAVVLSNRVAAVPLLSGDCYYGGEGCYLDFAIGELVVDPVAGTAITNTSRGMVKDDVRLVPVKWPAGYTGRRSGFEVEVLARNGHVVARTGSRFRLQGGYEGDYWMTCSWTPTPVL